MNRRGFLKRGLALLAVCYTNPVALIPDTSPLCISVDAGAFEMESTMVYSINSFSKDFIEPAARRLADSVDKYMLEQMEGNYAT